MELSDGDSMKSHGINKVSLPFYEPPQRKTSAEIINEARLAIRESQMAENNFAPPAIKPLQTQRPYTPRDKERLLLRYLQNETELPNTPPDNNLVLTPNMIAKPFVPPTKIINKTLKHQRSNSLSEINDKIFNIAVKDAHKVKLPSLDPCRPLQKRKIFKNTSSLDNLDKKKDRNVEGVLRDLNLESIKKYEEEKVNCLLRELYECMEKENLVNSKVPSKLKVTGNNLSGVCKLIFKVAKHDKNDHLFFQKNLLELFLDALGRSSPVDDAEACVYGYGAVKFLTMNPQLLEKILGLGILQLMVLHIKMINMAKLEKSTIIISTNECCCDSIIEYKSIYRLFIHLFDKYPGNEEIIVRLTYTLGNIVAKIDNTRVKFFYEEKSIECLLNLWKIYLERTLQNCSLKLEVNDEFKSNSEDVMIKKYGSQLIDEVLKVLISNPFKKNEELVLSILSTLNNLSYYYTTDLEVDIFHVKQVDIVEDEEKLFGIEEHTDDMDVYVTQEYLIWEEFANVATNLLEKIEYFLDTFDQINIENNKTETKKTKDNSTNLSLAAW
ncbi:hypothetical protein NQ314_017609 [Rhamnusium bicolor]|uniref:Uncharacterized protein n=1 Tax=Rhamnusium bicolor TaxID=1586634 RepID=A0AAV8WU32_9CUCU|nr:hypothetical protein NQ314_017609 [Rhamnusium bicolor]